MGAIVDIDLPVKKVLVAGAGLMGCGIALVFAARGSSVLLTDADADSLARAKEVIRRHLIGLAEHGLESATEIEAILNRISVTADLEEGAAAADFVVEAVFENLPLKQDLFGRLDAICGPEVILATNTSVMSITEIAARTARPERVVGTHFWNPPHLIPLVEVVPGRHTSPATMDKTFALLAALGKHPVRVKQDVPGFVGNRLQHALWREAVSIVERGIAEAEVVDEVVKFGFGARLPVLGPLENAELVGLDLTLAIHTYLFGHLESSPLPSPLLTCKVERGELGFKSGRGFREWDEEKKQQVRENLEEYLYRWLRERQGQTGGAGRNKG
jgi:3-hydroxybutyryl-CoA dehydrogenase